jgi:hypothetical protein
MAVTPAVPAYLEARMGGGLPLPEVQVVPLTPTQTGGEVSAEEEEEEEKKKKAEAEEEEEEERHAMLNFVVRDMEGGLYRELFDGMMMMG